MSITSPSEVIRSQLSVNNATSIVGNEIMANAMGKDQLTCSPICPRSEVSSVRGLVLQ